jgi:hypothetical protein
MSKQARAIFSNQQLGMRVYNKLVMIMELEAVTFALPNTLD